MNQRAVAEFRASMAPIDSQIEMRVAIAEAVPSLTISTSTEASLLDPQRQPLQQIAAEKSYTVAPSGSSIQFGDWELPDIVWVEPPPGGLVRVGDRTYRGALLVVLDSGKLWAVNLVSLRQYLHSVVGSEVSPSWPPDALKAQAVAARSYALTYFFRPFSPLFHLGATEYYQVYKGIESEAESTKQAVDQTGGQFVSRRGDVVESLYAASDDIVAEAFQGHGMSQLGALDLSEQGYTYKEILKKYYPGTGVGRIANEIE
jgi:peptidoglycan hydrolase-like amidase